MDFRWELIRPSTQPPVFRHHCSRVPGSRKRVSTTRRRVPRQVCMLILQHPIAVTLVTRLLSSVRTEAETPALRALGTRSALEASVS